MNLYRILILFIFLNLGNNCLAQTEETTESEGSESTYEEQEGFYLSGGANFGTFYGDAFPARLPLKIGYQLGLNMKFSFIEGIPSWAGVEFQTKNYSYNISEKGATQSGKAFEKYIQGNTKLAYLNGTFLFQLPVFGENSRLKLLAGMGSCIRIYYHERFSGSYKIPSDTLEIPLSYEKYGSDSFDFMDVNALAGINYSPLNWMDIRLQISQKLFGMSIGKENFFTTQENNTLFGLQAYFRVAGLELWPF